MFVQQGGHIESRFSPAIAVVGILIAGEKRIQPLMTVRALNSFIEKPGLLIMRGPVDGGAVAEFVSGVNFEFECGIAAPADDGIIGGRRQTIVREIRHDRAAEMDPVHFQIGQGGVMAKIAGFLTHIRMVHFAAPREEHQSRRNQCRDGFTHGHFHLAGLPVPS